jgi:hypothetical protein
MADLVFDWSPVEPAHETAVKLHEDLRSIYRYLKENVQTAIDRAFDTVSRRIGYVVVTTIPVMLKVDSGRLELVGMGAKHLEGTLFADALSDALEDLPEMENDRITVGTYTLPLIWAEALKVRLRFAWVEPAHFRLPPLGERRARSIVWEAHEPAHWFDPSIRLASSDAVLISVIDEVYPEIGLARSLTAIRQASAYEVGPGVCEPAHPGEMIDRGVSEGRVGPGVREPAHPALRDLMERPEAAVDVLRELASVLRRFGL